MAIDKTHKIIRKQTPWVLYYMLVYISIPHDLIPIEKILYRNRVVLRSASSKIISFIHLQNVLKLLAEKGHSIYYYCYIPSGFHGILAEDGKLHAYVDQRKFDCPAGF
jgi:hypothetical protein